MAGIFTKRIWQPCICQPNDLKIKKKTEGAKGVAKQNSWGAMALPDPPLESPLHMWPATAFSVARGSIQEKSSLKFPRTYNSKC